MSLLSMVDVRWLQRSLKESGHYGGKVDGAFGSGTEKALADYLKAAGLPESAANQVASGARQQMASKPRPPAPVQDSQQAARRAQAADRAGAAARDKFSEQPPGSAKPCPKINCPPPGPLGSLSAKYESGRRGAAAIGNDNTGGWSYGKYQIETKRGTMKKFLAFCEKKSPATAAALAAAGGNDAAVDGDPEFKQAWEQLAKAPSFADVQHEFIADKNYEPLSAKIGKDTGLDVGSRSPAVQDVVWSVAVQHGPGAEVVTRALKGRDVAKMSDEQIIDAIYDERAAEKTDDKGRKVLKYFSKSTEDVQKGVRKRFEQERVCAKRMAQAQA